MSSCRSFFFAAFRRLPCVQSQQMPSTKRKEGNPQLSHGSPSEASQLSSVLEIYVTVSTPASSTRSTSKPPSSSSVVTFRSTTVEPTARPSTERLARRIAAAPD